MNIPFQQTQTNQREGKNALFLLILLNARERENIDPIISKPRRQEAAGKIPTIRG